MRPACQVESGSRSNSAMRNSFVVARITASTCGCHPAYSASASSTAPAADQDSRDGGRKERQEVVATHEGVWTCTFVGACSEVCPAHVDPASALQQMKITSSIDWIVEHLIPGGKA